MGNERGEGRIGSIIGFLVLAACVYSIWNVVPVYWTHYGFQDKMAEVGRLSKYMNPDENVMSKLMGQVRDYGLEEYIKPSNCSIKTGERSRKIVCNYERVLKILPGYTKVMKFEAVTDQPLL